MIHKYCQTAMSSARTPHEIRASPRFRGAFGYSAGRTPGICCKRSRNWTIAKPQPISATAVRIHDIIVRSMLRRVRIQLKWLSEVTLTSNLPALGEERGSAMPDSLLLTIHVGPLTARSADARPRDAQNEPSDDHVRDKCKQQRDDERLIRIECLEREELIDYVHRYPQKDDSGGRVQSLAQPSNAFLRIAQHCREIRRAADS